MTGKSSKLLIDEPPLQVLPTLACLVGLNESIVLQQIKYWLYLAEQSGKGGKLGVYKQNRWWIYNNLAQWQKNNFPFWSVKTTQRALDRLRELRVVIVRRLSDNNLDQTLYYTIDYDQLNWLLQAKELTDGEQSEPSEHPPYMGVSEQEPANLPFGQNDQMEPPFGQNDQMHLDNLTISIWSSCPTVNKESETTSETTQREQILACEVWKNILIQLKAEMPWPNYQKYAADLRPVSLNGSLVLASPSAHIAGWCHDRLGRRIEGLLAGELLQPVPVEFIVKEKE